MLNFLGGPDTHQFPLMSQAHLLVVWQELSASWGSFPLSCWPPTTPWEGPSLPDWVQGPGVATPWTGPGDGSHPLCHRLPQSPPCCQSHSRTWGGVLQPRLTCTHARVHTLCRPAQGTGQLRAEHTAPLNGTSGQRGAPCCPFCDMWFLLSSLPGEE